jgi:hypothetical protein
MLSFQDKEMAELCSGNWHLVTEGPNIYFCEYRPGTEIREGRGVQWNGSQMYECYWKNNNYHGMLRRIYADGTYFLCLYNQGSGKWRTNYNKHGEPT